MAARAESASLRASTRQPHYAASVLHARRGCSRRFALPTRGISAVKDVDSAASGIAVAASMYDEWPLHEALRAALRRKCSVRVLVAEQYTSPGRYCRDMKARLSELKATCAEVLLDANEDGKRGQEVYGKNEMPGTFHVKMISLDKGMVA